MNGCNVFMCKKNIFFVTESRQNCSPSNWLRAFVPNTRTHTHGTASQWPLGTLVHYTHLACIESNDFWTPSMRLWGRQPTACCSLRVFFITFRLIFYFFYFFFAYDHVFDHGEKFLHFASGDKWVPSSTVWICCCYRWKNAGGELSSGFQCAHFRVWGKDFCSYFRNPPSALWLSIFFGPCLGRRSQYFALLQVTAS